MTTTNTTINATTKPTLAEKLARVLSEHEDAREVGSFCDMLETAAEDARADADTLPESSDEVAWSDERQEMVEAVLIALGRLEKAKRDG